MNNYMKILFQSGFVILIMGFAMSAIAQQHIQHQSPTLLERGETKTLGFSAPGLRTDQIGDIYLMYRVEGDLAFNRLSADIEQNNITANVRIDNTTANSLEYYLRIELLNGSIITFPENNPEGRPISVNLVGERDRQRDVSGNVQYNVLSPQPGGSMTPEDVLVAIALFYADETEQPDSVKVYFDGRDVTGEAAISPYFISYIPDNLPYGTYEARVAYFVNGQENTLTSWSFELINPRLAMMQADSRRSVPSGRIEFNARNQVYSGDGSDIYRGNLRLSGSTGNIRYSASGLLTSQESSRLQPQNRFAAEVYVGDWFRFQAGHVYPQLNPLLMSGRRMYGINSTISTPGKVLNLNVLHGNLSRRIGLQYTAISQRTDTLSTTGSEPVTETSFVMGLQTGGSGTYERKLTGARLGFGSGRNFQLGINALKVEDDVNSLEVINAFEDIPLERLNSELTTQQIDMLNEDPDMFRLEASNPNPRGNFMFGTDLGLNLHSNRIQVKADLAASLYNTNISDGVLDQTTADDMGFELDGNLENALDRLSQLIIINENMSTLPVRFRDGDAEAFVPMGIFAGQARVGLNYFRNNLTIQYRWVGPDYVSLANSSIRRDIAGYTITDRFRLLQNTVYVTLGHERLEDNVIGNRDATTVRSSYNANISWYPISQVLPRISAGVNYQDRDNSVVRQVNPYLDAELASSAVRNVHLENEEPRLLPNPRSARTIQYTGSISREFNVFDIVHDASLNMSDMKTVDDVFAFGDYDSRTYSAAITSRFQIPLRTTFALSSNNTNSVSGLNNIQINGINLGGSYYLLNNKLNIHADLSITQNTFERVALTVNDNNTPSNLFDDYYEPDFDDVEVTESNSYNIRSGVQYNINRNHSVILNMNLTNVVDRLGFQEIPNDRVLQARYVYNF